MARRTPFKAKIGKNIKHLRILNHMTQLELGEKLGVTYSAIANYESGYAQPDYPVLLKMAELFNVSTDYILGVTSIQNPKLFLESVLKKFSLTSDEYDILFKDILENNKMSLNKFTGNERLESAYVQIFNVYMNYLESNPLDFNINQINNDETLKKIKEYTEPINEKFINMLRTLDKYHIVEPTNEKNIINAPNDYIIKAIKVPVLGRISAGLPLFASENLEGYEYAPISKMSSDYDYFFLIVHGDSMNLIINDGDCVLIQKQPTLENGQIGAVRVNGDDATIKRYKYENGIVSLEPMSTNPIHEVQNYNPKKTKIEIIGKVISRSGDIN